MAEDVFGIVGTVQAGAFRVDEVVAEGGFAVVYRAYHGGFRTPVALKCLKIPETLTGEGQKEFLSKFREEAELLFRLSSTIAHVVRPLHVGTLSQTGGVFAPFIAIEWLDGETLDEMVAKRRARGEPPMPLGRVLELLAPVASALAKAHAFPGPKGTVCIVHRDLKPENIFVADVHGQEVPKILDFGIAKVKSAATQIVGRQSARQDAITAFTPAYGAPEQWLPKRFGQTGSWTDVWGLAMTAVECLAGYTPLDGDAAAIMGSAIDPVRRPTPRNEGVSVSDAVEQVFLRALAVDPRDRYHDVGRFWSDLEAAAAGASFQGRATPNTLAGRAPSGSLPPDPHGRTRVAERTRLDAPAHIPDLAPQGPTATPSAARSGPMARPAAARRPASAAAPDAFFGSGPLDDALGMHASGLDVQRVSRPRARRARAMHGVGHAAARARPDLGRPITLLSMAVLLMGIDWGYATTTGELLQVGPARMLWLAGPIALIGAISLAYRLVSHD